jgi:hypothetical protein
MATEERRFRLLLGGGRTRALRLGGLSGIWTDILHF